MANGIWESLARELGDAAEEHGRSVVTVLGRRHPASGVLWSADAVVTVNHALRRDEQVHVTLAPGKTVNAKVAGRDVTTDLAVLRLETPVEQKPATWAGTASLRVGELVMAIARTWRGNIVASSGVISGLMGPWRTWRGGELDQFIRPDLSFFSGFSGGALVSPRGILGITTAGLHRSPITIPTATVSRVATELLEKGSIERPHLGVAMQAVPLQESQRGKLNLKATEGLLIVHVESESPADKAGVLLGDILVELGGTATTSTEEVQHVLRSMKADTAIEASVIRGGTLHKVNITPVAKSSR